MLQPRMLVAAGPRTPHWPLYVMQHNAAHRLQQLLSNDEALEPAPQRRLGLADGEAPEVRK